jgi:c-di-GMP-binding flagellar brake protein YcgR
VRIVEVRDGHRPTWLVRPDGPVHLIQRRAHVRAPTLLAAIVIPPGQEALPALVVDLSEGGLRCSLASDLLAPIAPGVEVVVSFKLQNVLLSLDATIVRVEPPRHQRISFGARIRPSEEDAVRLRRYVLDWQRQVLAKGLTL